MANYVLGVDAGNTKTIALVARLDGTLVGAGRSGCGDIYGTSSPEAACETIAEAVHRALKMAGIQPRDLAAGAFSLAGADWPEDYEFLQTAMRSRGFGHTITIVNDALGALRAGSPDGTGVSIVCGTGAATGARAVDGRMWHSSFWQVVQGSHALGRKLLHAVYRAELGLGPPTALTQRTLESFQVSRVEEVLHLLTRRNHVHPASYLGKLARVLLEEAEKGDSVARRIVEEHGTELADFGLVAARQVGLEGTPFNLILAGSVLRTPGSSLARSILDRVRRTAPGVQAIHSRYEPAVGALFLAFESVGVLVQDSLLARLNPTLPSSSLFET